MPLPQEVGEILFDRLPDALLLLSRDGEILRRNAAAEALKKELAQALSLNRSASPVEVRNGEGGWLEVTAEPVEAGFLIRLRDITALKMAEEAVKRRDERARLILKSTNDILWWADPQRGFIEPQEPWEQFTGQTFDEYKHWGHVAAIHPDDRERVQSAWYLAAQEKRACACEYRVFCPSKNEYRYCMAKGVPMLDQDGEIREWVGTLADIHDLKEAQERLHELNQQLEARVRERTEALNIALRELEAITKACTQDLRNYLRGIIANTRYLAEAAPEMGVDSSEYLNQITLHAHHLAQMVDDLLAFTYLRRESVTTERIDLSRLTSEVISDLKPPPEIQIRVAERMTMRGDTRLIRRALYCLLDNACKFSPSGGAVEVSLERDASHVTLRVSDQGIGFETEYLSRALLPFERLHSDRTFSGTGIGLAMVSYVVERHGGRIAASSTPGSGSTFELVIPIEPIQEDLRSPRHFML